MSFIFTMQATYNSHSPQDAKGKLSEWIGHETKKVRPSSSIPIKEEDINGWKDVADNIKQMDNLYDATFHAWLKSEENVLVTSIYLHRIANEYPLERIANALEWLTSDWRWESVCTLIKHMTIDWCDDYGDIKRASLLRSITNQWAIHYLSTLISTLLMASPYATNQSKRERFLAEFTKDWDFSKLSEFFMFIKTKANINYKFKCHLLKEAAKKDILIAATNKGNHKRTSSNEFNNNNPTTSTSTSTSNKFHIRTTTANNNTLTTSSSTSTSQQESIPSPSSSSSNNDKKKISSSTTTLI